MQKDQEECTSGIFTTEGGGGGGCDDDDDDDVGEKGGRMLQMLKLPGLGLFSSTADYQDFWGISFQIKGKLL
jgi:hypothetical protein